MSCGGSGGKETNKSCQKSNECSEGLICQENKCIDESILCENKVCNNGNCIVENWKAVCDCNTGYSYDGDNCVADDPCNNMCGLNQICNEITKQCEDEINPCDGVDCSNHGHCEAQNNAPVCFCDEGYIVDGLNCIFHSGCTPNPEGEICGDGFDNTCNNQIDEGCSCNNGETADCYAGNISTINIGICKKGSMSCIGGEAWGECLNQVLPTEDICDGLDNDCNNTIDKYPNDEIINRLCYSGSQSELTLNAKCKAGIQYCTNGTFENVVCEGEILPDSRETCGNGIDDNCNGFVDEECGPPVVQCSADIEQIYIIEGQARLTASANDSNSTGSIVSTTWTFFEKPAGSQSALNPAIGLNTVFTPDTVGMYIVRFTAVDNDGESAYCDINVNAKTRDFLNVNLTWDKGGRSDMDLHLLMPGVDVSRWNKIPDDCYWANRNPEWFDVGVTNDNPRLDLDDMDGYGPEVIQLLRPKNGRYTVGVNYFDDQGQGNSTATVKIICNGEEFTFSKQNMARSSWWIVKDIIWDGEHCTVGEPTRVFK